MASLNEAYGCSFSETFELIDENFKLNSEDVDEVLPSKPVGKPEVVLMPGREMREEAHECDKIQLHLMRCPGCKELRYQKDATNMLLIMVIGLLLFMIVERRMKN